MFPVRLQASSLVTFVTGVTGNCCPFRQASENCTFWVTLHIHSISGIDLYIDHYSMVEISLCIYSYLFSSDCMRDKLTIAVSETFHYISLTVYCMIKSLPVQVCNTHVCTSLYVCGCVHACACVSVRANVVFCENVATFLLKNNICTPDNCPEPGS